MIGVLGAGQLGRMLALAGYPLGLRFRFLDSAHEAPIRDFAELVRADFRDADALVRFAAGLEVATYEFENVPVEAAEKLAQRVPVFPPVAALRASQDRLDEKTFFRQLDIPTAPFVVVRVRADLDLRPRRGGLSRDSQDAANGLRRQRAMFDPRTRRLPSKPGGR